MKKFVLALLIGTVALAPAFAAAQTGSGSGGSGTPGTSNPSGSGSSGSGSTGTMPSTKTPGSSGAAALRPSASPSGSDMSMQKTQADCEKAGGMWSTATSKCGARSNLVTAHAEALGIPALGVAQLSTPAGATSGQPGGDAAIFFSMMSAA